MKKSVEKAIEKLRDECEKNNCQMIMAVTDKKGMHASLMGSIVDVASLIMNFKEADKNFKTAYKLEQLLSNEKNEVGSTAEMMAEMIMGAGEEMETKKGDC